MRMYLNSLFNSDEWVNVCYTSVRETKSQRARDIRDGGQWVCVNPLKADTTRRTSNIQELRNFVIEFDDMSMRDQILLANRVSLPYCTAVFSGNKSIHFVIALTEAVDAKTYRALSTRIKRALPGCDKHCLEPARLTRIPNQSQPLLKVKRRISLEELEQWLVKMGASEVVEARQANRSGVPQRHSLTRTSKQFLAGLIPGNDAHRASIHVIKNLLELSYSYNDIVEIITNVRQEMRPGESREHADERTKKIVDWVYHEWR